MIYSLWDMETNNLVAEYATKREALMLVLRGLKRNGPDDAESLSLDAEDEHGQTVTIASGRDLAELAKREIGALPLAG